jgi:hypothetical protein
MVTIDCTADAHNGVTLVTARLRDINVPTQIRVESRLDGPVWPPRREGLPEPGWTDTGFDGVVGPGTEVLGYATPASPSDPPAELVDWEPVPDAEPREELTEDTDSVVRHLGDPSPPADAVPASGSAVEEPTSNTPDGEETEPGNAADPPVVDRASHAVSQRDTATAELPAAVGPWLAEMARRVNHAERLAEAETVPAATAAVSDADGMAGVRDLAEADDAQRLRTLARRARRLADRRAAATVPVETLDRLA